MASRSLLSGQTTTSAVSSQAVLATPHRKSRRDGIIPSIVACTFAERLTEAVGEKLVFVLWPAHIHWPRLCVVYPSSTHLPTEMGWMICDTVAVFNQRVNLFWCPRLTFLKHLTQLGELCGSKPRRPTAAEAWAQLFDTTVISRMSPCASWIRRFRHTYSPPRAYHPDRGS